MNDAANYYTDNITGIPFRGLLHAFKSQIPLPLAFVFAAMFRIRGKLNWPLKPMYASKTPGHYPTIQYEQLPRECLIAVQSLVEPLWELGFHELAVYSAESIGAKRSYSVVLADQPGQMAVSIEWMQMPGVNGIQEKIVAELSSRLHDGTQLNTGCTQPEDIALINQIAPEWMDAHYLPIGTPIGELVATHRQRIHGKSVEPLNPNGPLQSYQQRTRRVFDSMLERGIIRILSEKEVEIARSRKPPG